MSKLVSVVIPCYNSARFVSESVRAVLDQTYPDVEALVVDDGSTDDTRDVARGFKDARVRYTPMDQRRGNYFARNYGLSQVRGSFVAFLDADDLWTKDKLRPQMEAFESQPALGVSFTDHYVFEDSRPERRYKDLVNTYPDDGRERAPFMRKLIEGNFIITSSVVARRECFDRLGGFDTAFQNAMDYDMWLRLVLNYPFHYHTGRAVLKRVHGANISRNQVNSFKAVAYIFDKLLSEKERHAFFTPDLVPLIERRKQVVQHKLGLEYLEAGEFENAARCLENCALPEKRFFRRVALLAARTRFEPLRRLIHFYRSEKQKVILAKVS